MRYIYKRIGPLKKINIMTNKWMMATYVCLWLGHCISATGYYIILSLLVIDNELEQSGPTVELFLIFPFFMQIFYTSIDCLTLYTFFLMSNNIE